MDDTLDNYFSAAVIVYADKNKNPDRAISFFGMAPSAEAKDKVLKYLMKNMVSVNMQHDKNLYESVNRFAKEVSHKFNVECYGSVINAVIVLSISNKSTGMDGE